MAAMEAQAKAMQAGEAAALQQAAALQGVGQAIDEREQQVMDEPLKYLMMRNQMLNSTPYSTTTERETTQKMSGLQALSQLASIGTGIAGGGFLDWKKFLASKQLPPEER